MRVGGRCGITRRLDLCEEPVTSTRNSLEIRRTFRRFTERSSQNEYMLRQVALLHESVWPDFIHQHVFFHQMPCSPHENQKCIQGLGWQRHDSPIAKQNPFVCI